MDGPRRTKQEATWDARKLVETFAAVYPDRISLRLLQENAGSAVHVITAIDWFFRNNNEGVILEDDCIPHKDFFQYATHALNFLENNNSIWFFSGFRPNLQEFFDMEYMLCNIPLNWGWGTTRKNWNTVRSFISDKKVENLFVSLFFGPSRVYWNIGYRRIMNGWVDAWDTAIAYLMIKNGKYSLIPNVNLISNIGNDHLASNTTGNSIFLNSKTHSWNKKALTVNMKTIKIVNKHLLIKMIRVKKWHLITPIFKYILQKICKFHKNFGELNSRLKKYDS